MRLHVRSPFIAALAVLLSVCAAAQERGFQLHRYAGTSAGSRLFLVERPWYSDDLAAAVGVTFDYSHRPLVPRVATGGQRISPIVLHALVGHVDIAGSLFDRLVMSATLPVTFLERGTMEPVSGVGPLQTVAVGDPRVGFMVRLLGQSERDFLSAHIGADVWIPIGAQATHQGDGSVRLLPRAVLAGALGVSRWTLEAGYLYRAYESYGPPALGMTAGSELRLGLALSVALAGGRVQLGPEAQFATQVIGVNAFAVNGMNLELLGGLNFLLADHVLLGLAGGAGLLGAAGTADARAMVRLAWTPRRSSGVEAPGPDAANPVRLALRDYPDSDLDSDGDGVPDALDRCPFEPETKNGIRDADGCPEFASEPGSPIARVLAPPIKPPAAPPGARSSRPDAGFSAADAGFITEDSDADGVPDEVDACPVTPEDLDGFEDEDGCPEPDNDSDGIADTADLCPNEAEVFNGIKDDDGCPDAAPDADEDGVSDALDRCPLEPETRDGVRDEDGCPELPSPSAAALARLLAMSPTVQAADGPAAGAADSDQDGVPDELDRCPLTPEDRDGFEDEDGCPEPDNDDDGVPDARDLCPDVAETINTWKDDDGCPDEQPDVDGDGVGYVADRCPLEPGNAADGCPHLPLPPLALPGFTPAGKEASQTATPTAALAPADFDHDGIPDEEDLCPSTPEDRDGFEDEDGCPEPDNDQDGIADAADKCPFEAEVINGIKDDDGCPDVGVGAVSIRAGAVVVKGIIQFKTASATLQPASFPLLKQVAGTLRAAASVSVEIQGHTDDVGSAVKNIALSKRRAETIRTFLIRAGVPPQRLVATGFGPLRPRASNQTPSGREQNRRVEFLIVGEAK